MYRIHNERTTVLLLEILSVGVGGVIFTVVVFFLINLPLTFKQASANSMEGTGTIG